MAEFDQSSIALQAVVGQLTTTNREQLAQNSKVFDLLKDVMAQAAQREHRNELRIARLEGHLYGLFDGSIPPVAPSVGVPPQQVHQNQPPTPDQSRYRTVPNVLDELGDISPAPYTPEG
jgi:hypothetical protein